MIEVISLLNQIKEIAAGNNGCINRTMVEDLIKESHPDDYMKVSDMVYESLARDHIEIEPEEPEESYFEYNTKNADNRFVPADVNIRYRTMTIDQIVARLNYHEIDLQPGFQRKGDLWNSGMQSQLIESLMLKIPLPAFYFDARDDNKWIVIDGLQRLSAFGNFFVNKTLSLTNLEYMTEMNGKKYDELPRQYVRRIMESSITVYTVERGTPEEIVYNIFKRINTGGISLEPQEIRHALYQGKATELINRLAESKAFKIATGGAISSRRMRDREFVNRYMAFTQLDIANEYEGNIDQFLISAIKKVNNYSSLEMEIVERRFNLIMETCHEIFQRNAFRRYSKTRRGPINKAIFEIWSACLYDQIEIKRAILIGKKEQVEEHFQKMMSENSFSRLISNGDKQSVVKRINLVKQMLETIIYD